MSVKRHVVPACLGVMAAAVPVAAHVPGIVTPDRVWRSWSFEPLVLFVLLFWIWIYTRGVMRVWARAGHARVITRANTMCFCGGMAALVVALVSPLDSLGGTLLSAHMVQHGVLAGVAPPLLLLARPGVAFAWALKPVWNADPRALTNWRRATALTRSLSTPWIATVIHAVMLWGWHAPALFGAAVVSDWVHALQHVCFFVPSLFFWRALLDGDSPRRAAISMVAAFLTFMHTGLLGGLLTMAPEALYAPYVGRTAVWGFSALEDQQLAGVLMWVPLGLPYLIVGLWLASRVVAVAAPPQPATRMGPSRVVRRESTS